MGLETDLVLTSSLHLVMTVESSKRMGNHAFTHTQSELLWSSSVSANTCGPQFNKYLLKFNYTKMCEVTLTLQFLYFP